MSVIINVALLWSVISLIKRVIKQPIDYIVESTKVKNAFRSGFEPSTGVPTRREERDAAAFVEYE